MKGHFSVGILLLFCAYGALCASNLVKRDNEAEKQQMVDKINQARQTVAVQKNIANMHEMSYDTNLEIKVKTLSCNKEPDGDFIVVAMPTENAYNRDTATLSPEEKQKIDAALQLQFLAFLHPDLKRIGCAEIPNCEGEACALGPKVDLGSNEGKSGAPGSACPNGRTDSGLCKSGSGGSGGFGTAVDVQSGRDLKGAGKKMGRGAESSSVGGIEKGEDNGSNHSSLIALLLIVLLI